MRFTYAGKSNDSAEMVQNRRQRVVNRGPLRLCGGGYVRAGGLDIQI